MKAIIQRIRTAAILAVLFAIGLASTAWATTTRTNPVTGQKESYANTFTGGSDGTGTEWNDSSNWDTSVKPFVTGNYEASLVDGKTASTSTAVDGWTLRVGAYNGASVSWNGGITKIQAGTAGCWLTADGSSSITIASFGENQLEGSSTYPLKLSSAKAGGITWNCGLTATSSGSDKLIPFHYYIDAIHDGTVVYTGNITVGNAQVIKQVNVKLTGTSQVSSKTLVTFGSGTTKAFTADAAIKFYDADGTTLVETVNLAEVKTAPTLTTSNPVGSVELVQTSTGIVLYYVNGDPSAVVAKTYTPSININFTNGSANGLTTSADVGLTGYAVPGTSWNNFEVANNANTQTFGTVAAIDSTGVASTAAGVSVTVSNQRGRHQCSLLAPATDLRYGYIDEGSSTGQTSPTVTITGIPYDHYRVIVYHSTDTANAKFGYDTINGVNFTYVDGVQQKGTASWGASGASNSAEAIAEGVNTLVSSVMSGDTVTMVAHRIGGDSPTARGCFAAIQVVEYVPEVGENDLEIAVDGATSYSVDDAKTLSGTVYLTGSGTLTLTGSEKITAAAIDVGKDVVLNIDAARLDATTFTGSGMVVYDGASEPPVTGKGWADIGWSGTVWVKNQTVAAFNGNSYGNAGSTIRFTGVTGHLARKTAGDGGGVTQSVPIELLDDGSTVAFHYNNGWGGSVVSISTLKGTGTLKTSSAGNGEIIYIANADGFTGSFDLAHKKVQLGGSEPGGDNQNWNGRLYIPSGVTITQASGTTWTAANSFDIAGTLYVNGTLASSHASQAVIGSGTVVFTGRAPTPTGDTWWKNSRWTGTVQMKNVTDLVGASSYSGTNFLPLDYGNTGSVLELNNCSGWLPNNSNYQCTVPLKVTGTLTINNGVSGNKFVVSHLSGDGTIYTDSNAATVTIQVLEAENFTGYVKLNSKRVVFCDTLPSEFTGGNIYVGKGFTFTVPNSNVAWYGTGGITLAGELKAAALSNFGGGTTITTTDTGVFTFINSNNTRDHDGQGGAVSDYARITGTGTLRYADVSGKWRSLARTNFPTGMICENNLSAGLILTGTSDNTIGSLSGSGVMRSDWGGSANDNGRPVTILQAKDTVYSGVFHSDDRISTVTVAAGATTSGTLTLSGTQTVSNGLNVQAGVNLTGTWVGATTVSGTFGGTGTLKGNLTFNAGSTFKVFDAAGDGTADTDADGLNVSGAVTVGDSGTVTVTIADGASIASETVILKATSISGTFELDSSLAEDYELTTTATTLAITPIDHNIYTSDGETVVGYMDGTTAVITDTSAAIAMSALGSATKIKAYPTTSVFTLKGITESNIGPLYYLAFWATVGGTEYNITGAFTGISKIFADETGTYLVEDGDTYTVNFMLEGANVVSVEGTDICVTPALADSAPVSVSAAAVPTFSVKTIPGLWYAVKSGTAISGDTVGGTTEFGTAAQANSASTTVTGASAPSSGVKYYKVVVGVSEDEMQ